MKPLNIRIELLIHLYLIGIELDFGAVKQRFLACKAGYHLIYSLYEFDYIHKSSVRHCGCKVTCHRVRKGRTNVTARQILLPCALTCQNITVSLNEDVTVGKHIHKFADFLCIRYRLIKRRTEIVAAKNSEVRIVALCIFIAVPVYHGKRIVVVILLADKAAGILAECTHLICERFGIAYKL